MSREHTAYPSDGGGGEAPGNFQGQNARGNNNSVSNMHPMGRVDQGRRPMHNNYADGMGQGNMDNYQRRMPMMGYPGQQPQDTMGMAGFPHGMDGPGAMMMGQHHNMAGYDMRGGGGPGHYSNDMMNHRRAGAPGGRAPGTSPGNANAASTSSEAGNNNSMNNNAGSPSTNKNNLDDSNNKGGVVGASGPSMQDNFQMPEQNEALMRKMMLAQQQQQHQRGQEEMLRLAQQQQQQGRPGPMDHANMGGFGGPMGNNVVGEQTTHEQQQQQKSSQGRMQAMYDGMGGSANNMGTGIAGGVHNAFGSGMGDDAFLRQHQNSAGGAGSKRNAPSGMPYDPSAYGGAPMKYPPHPHFNMMQHHAHAMAHQQGVHPMHMQAPSALPLASQMPPPKKRRSHKKKPPDMPRRPLSAYNLFFSEERERILKELDDEKDGETDETKEEGKSDDVEVKKEDESEKEREDSGDKPKALMRPLVPNQKTRRPHRKTHGKISFQQLAKMVGQRWKSLPDEKRKKYQDLAQEDMKRQKVAMEEYYSRQQAMKHNGQMEKPIDGNEVKVMNQMNM